MTAQIQSVQSGRSDAGDETISCPACRAPMQTVVSGRYYTCTACAMSGRTVYVPVGDAPPHPMHGAPIAAAPETQPSSAPGHASAARGQHMQGVHPMQLLLPGDLRAFTVRQRRPRGRGRTR